MNTAMKTTPVKMPGTPIALAVVLAGIVFAYGAPLAVAPYALPFSIAGAVVAWIEIHLRNNGDGSRLSLGGAAFILVFGTGFLSVFFGQIMMSFPGLAPRAPLMGPQYAEISKNLEESPTPAIRARRNRILAEEARDGALDLRGYLTYFDRVSVDTVERQLGNAG